MGDPRAAFEEEVGTETSQKSDTGVIIAKASRTRFKWSISLNGGDQPRWRASGASSTPLLNLVANWTPVLND